MTQPHPPADGLTLVPGEWGAPPGPAGRLYRAEVYGEGPVAGTKHRAGMTLGRFTSPSPGRVLRWLRTQALRIADGLDPDPATTPHPTALRLTPPPCPARPGDVPTEFRTWAERDGHRLAARHLLAAGLPFLLIGADHTGCYALTAWPLTTAGPAYGAPPAVRRTAP
jgi:hypothetical protein